MLSRRGRPPGGTRATQCSSRKSHQLWTASGQICTGGWLTVTDQALQHMVISRRSIPSMSFNIQKTSYARNWRKSGAVIKCHHEIGHESVHGALLEFVRNDVFAPRTSSIPPRPRFRVPKTVGGSFGGPILRTGLLFRQLRRPASYASRLRRRFRSTDAMRRGDFGPLRCMILRRAPGRTIASRFGQTGFP